MNEIATIDVKPEQLDLIRRTVAVGATHDELQLFLYDCQRRGVHPLDKLLHFTKRSGKYTPITSIDLFRIRAGDTGEHAGTDDAIYGPLDDHGRPVKATITVYRIVKGVRYATTASAYWSEYYPGEGTQGFMWRKMPHTMLSKCAEAIALRKAFPQALSGLYTSDEIKPTEDDGSPVIVEPNGHDDPPAKKTPGRLNAEKQAAEWAAKFSEVVILDNVEILWKQFLSELGNKLKQYKQDDLYQQVGDAADIAHDRLKPNQDAD